MISFDVPKFLLDVYFHLASHRKSQRSLALEIGISPAFLCEMLQGKREPGIQTAAKLSAACCLNLNNYLRKD